MSHRAHSRDEDHYAAIRTSRTQSIVMLVSTAAIMSGPRRRGWSTLGGGLAAAAVVGVVVTTGIFQHTNDAAGRYAGNTSTAPAQQSAASATAALRLPTASPTSGASTDADSHAGTVRDEFASLGSPVQHEVRAQGIGADRVPAPVTTRPALSQSAAMSAAFSGFNPLDTDATAPTIVLGNYTNVLGRENADGSMTPSVPRQLAWIITRIGMSKVTGSRPYIIGASPPPTVTMQCKFVVVISATDASRLDAFRLC